MKSDHVHPVGTCCGREFYTWEGWHEHQLSHRSRYNLLSPWQHKSYRFRRSQDGAPREGTSH